MWKKYILFLVGCMIGNARGWMVFVNYLKEKLNELYKSQKPITVHYFVITNYAQTSNQ